MTSECSFISGSIQKPGMRAGNWKLWLQFGHCVICKKVFKLTKSKDDLATFQDAYAFI